MSASIGRFTDRAIDIVAEDKILAAIERGEFRNLAGFGQPQPICDEPYDPNWWIRRKLIEVGLTAQRQATPGNRQPESHDTGSA